MNDTLPPLREIIRKHDLRAKKSFGQNFLLDLNLTGKIARVAGNLDDSVVYEVGPGPGGLTRALLANGASRVVAVEMDERCLPALEEITNAFDNRLEIISGNALDINEPEAMKLNAQVTARIASNLPYNVGTLLFIKWLTLETWKPWYSSLTLMFQKEVAERIVAKPNTKAYGRLSVLAQWRGNVRIAMHVPAAAFTPPPKVDSAIIHYEPTEPIDPDVKLSDLELVVEKAFGQRRKMLRASLKSLPVDALKLLAMADIKETARAETLSVADFVKLAKTYRQLL
ncbi:16S rRNA (adenine(1518)-N(6)/adenine(1519)-N(6))-dimethyltransferase RsmA [Kordiimonas sp. SCSIO 12610]|uniref:16S rRNA (adenine(1518)-N(6)/adenine(1519)-N(6))- dimethyltransferase RsmA n=1 Tax=Kordiimonas sp. SCSIO 12610 TaxID=2829597 RepID=UPI00210B8111|nr:16S rRNA (adenine(1518)-N(6)/adenine(1519)-N(6))-dimethyltransferase RsmA [Kordiimonas sp. SCSIO 12610]UTW53873.1 16S rRNA (adenine(1518)-N(6)/adenine(1519)-N(6))-dimethyltransferase RsmA [Kordiimonas sp. SCSIO 12610]